VESVDLFTIQGVEKAGAAWPAYVIKPSMASTGQAATHRVSAMAETPRTSIEEARRVGDEIGVDWGRIDPEEFRAGMDVEYEHGSHDPQTDVTGDDPVVTGKIALAHLKEFPDYYERLARMEREAESEWERRRGS
jgi:hypothetical protein